jgi:hypothetical protein
VSGDLELDPLVLGGHVPARFRKRPVAIEAMRWMGDNRARLLAWAGPAGARSDCVYVCGDGVTLMIETREGAMQARIGDWIIRGVKGELYACKPDIFEQTYEEVPRG